MEPQVVDSPVSKNLGKLYLSMTYGNMDGWCVYRLWIDPPEAKSSNLRFFPACLLQSNSTSHIMEYKSWFESCSSFFRDFIILGFMFYKEPVWAIIRSTSRKKGSIIQGLEAQDFPLSSMDKILWSVDETTDCRYPS